MHTVTALVTQLLQSCFGNAKTLQKPQQTQPNELTEQNDNEKLKPQEQKPADETSKDVCSAFFRSLLS